MRGAFVLLLGVMGCSAGGEMADLVVSDEAVPHTFGVAAVPSLSGPCVRGAARWHEATGIDFACDNGRPMLWGEPERPCSGGNTNGDRILIRHRTPVTCTERPNWDIEGVNLDVVVAHELGHVLGGIGHASGGLMAEQPTTQSKIDQTTLAWACKLAPCLWQLPEE